LIEKHQKKEVERVKVIVKVQVQAVAEAEAEVKRNLIRDGFMYLSPYFL